MRTELSRREKEILEYMCKGYSNKEIADALHLKQQTVRNHISYILLKMGAKNRTHAVVMVLTGATQGNETASQREGSQIDLPETLVR